MLRSMYSAVSGLKAHQTRMDVIGNNIANVNTVGFKSSRVTFQDVYSQTIKTSSESTGNVGGTNPQQIGLGVHVGTIDTLFTPSGSQRTENPLDVSIEGDGFFIVQDPNTGGQLYTRAGNFYIDHNGIMTNGNGLKVLDSDGNEIDTTGHTNISIDKNGVIKGLDSSGVEVDIATLGIANFLNPSGLEKLGNNLYRETANSGSVIADDDLVAGNNGAGFLNVGALEMSNVDLAREFTDMIVTQRGFQANSRIITTSDQLLEELVNLKR